MSELSEKLEEFKRRRNLNVSDIAKECHMDISTIFRWMNGEREPSDITLLHRLGKAMHLTVKEMDELESIYRNNQWGEKYQQYKVCVDILRVIKDGEQYIQNENMDILMQDTVFRDDKTVLEETRTILPVFEKATREYQTYASLKKILNYIKENSIGDIQVMSRLADGETSWVFRFLFKELQGINIKQIVSIDDTLEESVVVKKLNALKNCLKNTLQNPGIKTYINQNMSMQDQWNWIICEDVVFLFDNSLRETILATDKTFVTLYRNLYDECLAQCKVVEAKRKKIEDFFENILIRKDTVIRSFEYQPCVASGLSNRILNQFINKELPAREEVIRYIYETFSMCSRSEPKYKVETYFTEAGMDDFCRRGIINIFKYPIYRPLNEAERKEIIDNIISLSEKEDNCHYLIKNQELEDIDNIHIQYVGDDVVKNVTLEFFVTEQETICFTLEDEDIIQGFESFFDYIGKSEENFNKEETIEYMKKKIEEYFPS